MFGKKKESELAVQHHEGIEQFAKEYGQTVAPSHISLQNRKRPLDAATPKGQRMETKSNG